MHLVLGWFEVDLEELAKICLRGVRVLRESLGIVE
jgi:hypothetical protein